MILYYMLLIDALSTSVYDKNGISFKRVNKTPIINYSTTHNRSKRNSTYTHSYTLGHFNLWHLIKNLMGTGEVQQRVSILVIKNILIYVVWTAVFIPLLLILVYFFIVFGINFYSLLSLRQNPPEPQNPAPVPVHFNPDPKPTTVSVYGISTLYFGETLISCLVLLVANLVLIILVIMLWKMISKRLYPVYKDERKLIESLLEKNSLEYTKSFINRINPSSYNNADPAFIFKIKTNMEIVCKICISYFVPLLMNTLPFLLSFLIIHVLDLGKYFQATVDWIWSLFNTVLVLPKNIDSWGSILFLKVFLLKIFVIIYNIYIFVQGLRQVAKWYQTSKSIVLFLQLVPMFFAKHKEQIQDMSHIALFVANNLENIQAIGITEELLNKLTAYSKNIYKDYIKLQIPFISIIGGLLTMVLIIWGISFTHLKEEFQELEKQAINKYHEVMRASTIQWLSLLVTNATAEDKELNEPPEPKNRASGLIRIEEDLNKVTRDNKVWIEICSRLDLIVDLLVRWVNYLAIMVLLAFLIFHLSQKNNEIMKLMLDMSFLSFLGLDPETYKNTISGKLQSIAMKDLTIGHEKAEGWNLTLEKLDINLGDIIVMCGPSGAGKSTLLSFILNTGPINLNPQGIAQVKDNIQSYPLGHVSRGDLTTNIGYCPQAFTFPADCSNMIDLFGRYSPDLSNNEILALLQSLELKSKFKNIESLKQRFSANEFSKGEFYRIVFALFFDHPFVFCDETFDYLNEEIFNIIMKKISHSAVNMERALMIVTHKPEQTFRCLKTNIINKILEDHPNLSEEDHEMYFNKHVKVLYINDGVMNLMSAQEFMQQHSTHEDTHQTSTTAQTAPQKILLDTNDHQKRMKILSEDIQNLIQEELCS